MEDDNEPAAIIPKSTTVTFQSPTKQAANQVIPGLLISKSQEKKSKKKNKGKSKIEDDFIWGSLETHPVFNSEKDSQTNFMDDKKRNAAAASLSPQDKQVAGKKNIKTQ